MGFIHRIYEGIMTSLLEGITDAEKVFAFLARLSEQLQSLIEIEQEDHFTLDVYSDDPGGVTGIISNNRQGLFNQYNGPYTITDILATWSIAGPPTSVRLQLGDRTLQFPPLTGVVNLDALNIEMARDDQVILTVTPAAACHLEIFANVTKRRRETVY